VTVTDEDRPAPDRVPAEDPVPIEDPVPVEDPVPIEDRGTLEVHPSVVRKVAERIADLTPGTLRAPRRIAGIDAGEHGASAKVGGFGGDVDVTLDVALHYPSPVHELADELRRRVTEEVHRITGYRVRSVRVTVSALLPNPRPRSRVE